MKKLFRDYFSAIADWFYCMGHYGYMIIYSLYKIVGLTFVFLFTNVVFVMALVWKIFKLCFRIK